VDEMVAGTQLDLPPEMVRDLRKASERYSKGVEGRATADER
jgi:hypothetical protein